jgi:hypothetical protein
MELDQFFGFSFVLFDMREIKKKIRFALPGSDPVSERWKSFHSSRGGERYTSEKVGPG